MIFKWVTVDLGEGYKCEVRVACTKDTPNDILQKRALEQLANRIGQVLHG